MGEIVAYLLEVIFAIIINVAVLIILVRNSSAKKATANIFLINLIVADIVTAIIGLVACFTHYIRKKMGVKDWTDDKMLILFKYIFTSTLLILLTATILVTLDRFLAIVKPYRYKEMATKRNVVILLVTLWSLSAVVLVLGVVFATMDDPGILRVAQDALDFVLIAVSFAGILFLVIANSIILREVRKQIKLVSSVSVFGNDEEAAKKSENSLRKKELRAAYLCFSIVCVFVICWLPVALGLALNRCGVKSGGRHLMDIGMTLVFLGVILNPCLYVPFKSELRRSLCKCFPFKKTSRENQSGYETKEGDRSTAQSSI